MHAQRDNQQTLPTRRWQRIGIERAAPWIMSGASTIYVVARAHRLSRAVPSEDRLLRFLLGQSDVLLMLCGSPVVWYTIMRRRGAAGESSPVVQAIDPQLIRQIRQVLSALMLGIGLLERRVAQGAYGEIGVLVQRLHAVVRKGAMVLEAFEHNAAPESALADFVSTRMSRNGLAQ